MKTAAVIQAAGKGSRFHSKGYKLLALSGGKPVIVKTLETVLAAGFDEIVVVIGCHAEEMRRILMNYPVKIIENTDWENGQSTSLSAGVRSIADRADRACLLLGDQPFLRSGTLKELLSVSDEHPDDVIVPEYRGKRGNPIVVPAYRFPLLLELTQGDMGGRKLLETVGYYACNTEDPGVIRDIDTIGDLNMDETNFWKIEDERAVPQNHGTKTISDTSAYTPIGAYTTFRTYERFGVLRLTKHLDRLEETSALAGFTVRLDRPLLKKILVQLIEAAEGEKRIRITIDLDRVPGTIYIAMEPLKTPDPDLYRNGIICLTAQAHRDNPKAKLSNFLARAESIRGQEEGHYDEILMRTEKGELLEGLSSNYYGVMDNTIYTAEEGVLSGTTRDFILRIAEELQIPVCRRPVMTEELECLDESFISSTSRSVLPVRSIDGVIMKKGTPGPVTQLLMDRFSAELVRNIEDLRSAE